MNSIYEFIEETNERSVSGKKLCKYRCKICGKVFLKREINTYGIKRCCHNNNHNGRLSRIYKRMIDRCYNTNNKDYKFYGYKNIIVCEEWLSDYEVFYSWAIKNGYKDDLTIDRINSSGNYEPSNCRWVSKEYNSRFKSTTNVITINGVSKSGNQWSKYLNKGKNYINTMIKQHGMEYTKNYIENNI